MGRVRALNVRESAFGRKLGGTAENFVPCICVHERTAYAGVFYISAKAAANGNFDPIIKERNRI